jgi:branched-subunit amino acid transport protein
VTVWLTIVAAGVGCYLLRISLVALLGGRQLSPAAVRTAGYVMPAAFASLAAVAVLDATRDRGSGSADPAPLLGALVAAGVAKRTSSSTIALVAGLASAAAVAAIR